MTHSLLFQPLQLRQVRAANRIVVSPMCQYSAEDGLANDWHFAHLAKFALGGAGIVFVEATAVVPEGRITHGDLGLWSERQQAPLSRITGFLREHGSVPAIQLGHAGRKASMQRPWFGNGPLNAEDQARGDRPWEVVAPSPLPVGSGWLNPRELSVAEIASLVQAFAEAARRAHASGFEVVEVHGAHGYLLHSFLSPLSNQRTDAYGGSLKNRMRFALEVTEAVRAAWPEELPLFFRVSAVDGVGGGWSLEDSVTLARELKTLGVDVVDCSSRGIAGPATASGQAPRPGFQVPYARRIREEAQVATQAVGLIVTPAQAEEVLRSGSADLVALAREVLKDPFWPRHAQEHLVGEDFTSWPKPYGWWLARRSFASGNPEDSYNALGQLVGFPVNDWVSATPPGGVTLSGKFCSVEPLQPELHGPELHEANLQDAEGRIWTYLPYGPFFRLEDYLDWLKASSQSPDPQFYAIRNQKTGKAEGVASYLRVQPEAGAIEVGHLCFSPAMQQSPVSTEAMFLMMQHVFSLGFRRYEWKCNALNGPSCQAAQRLGFSYEGLFRQAVVSKNQNRDTAWFAMTDRDWERLQPVYARWFDPTNFDPDGQQRTSLSAATRPLLHEVWSPAPRRP
jgi:2,4-dienoyl-CoA reductase-like NADH-dependent reductase (Old Yellow Enzyme family)/RimJ/RimL family protein N-acetyltransferase